MGAPSSLALTLRCHSKRGFILRLTKGVVILDGAIIIGVVGIPLKNLGIDSNQSIQGRDLTRKFDLEARRFAVVIAGLGWPPHLGP